MDKGRFELIKAQGLIDYYFYGFGWILVHENIGLKVWMYSSYSWHGHFLYLDNHNKPSPVSTFSLIQSHYSTETNPYFLCLSMSSYSDLKTTILSLPNEYSRTLQLQVVVDGLVDWISYIKNKKLLYTFSTLFCVLKRNYVALFSLNMCVISCKLRWQYFSATAFSLPYTLVLISHTRHVRRAHFWI